MTGHEFCATYLAVKLHFTQEKYNFFSGSGKAKIGEEAFNRRKDKFKFHRLARNIPDDEVVPFLVANFLENGECWTQNLLEEEARSAYNKRRRITQAMTEYYRNDLAKFPRDPKEINEMFAVHNGGHPKLLTMHLQGDILLETMVILNNIFQFLPKWDKEIIEDVIYPKVSRKIRKYGSFLEVNVAKYKDMTKTCLLQRDDI